MGRSANTLTTEASGLSPGALVSVRGSRWIVSNVDAAGATLVDLQSVEDGRYGESLSVSWEVEPHARVLPKGALPEVRVGGFDPPDHLAALLDAVRWGAVASADVQALQSPFRSGVAIEPYQLEPVARALTAPRVNLLLADDVGLGKTIEAGLVAQELLLRHRAKRILIVCPAGLTGKWKAEMAEKFGLDFTILNTEQCVTLRRTHGSAANPFRVYPLAIVSLPWLRSPRARRLLDEVLPHDGPARTREFDLLILDEAHHVAPAAPKQRYAVDSLQTKLIQRIAPHFEHRLFLSATPHNGYQESFTALLELIDDQRFVRGVEPDESARREVVIRRLKRDITNPDGSPRFRTRRAIPLDVDYPAAEREAHDLLTEFSRVRAERLGTTRRGKKTADLVTLLLKKRLFSSPEAFGSTVGVYLANLSASGKVTVEDDEAWVDDFFGEVADLDDEALAEEEDTAVQRATGLHSAPSEQELDLLRRMQDWAERHRANPDAKARRLLDFLQATCLPDGKHPTNERVVVFTEYRATQSWLRQQLQQAGLGGDLVALLHGGLASDERETLRQAFQADPAEHPVRILLATDAASEGIDLHWHCNKLVNYDIPFNPNKLEQRIGRIDRYGQTRDPEVRHFVGTGWQTTTDPFEADLEFLSRVAKKVSQMEEDLGAVNAVLASAVQRRMLGENVDIDAALARKSAQTKRGRVSSDRDVRERVAKLAEQLERTVADLHITPEAMERVVGTALKLAHQQPLTRVHDPDVLFDLPALSGSWTRASAGLAHPMRPSERRPVTFNPRIAEKRREDVVFAHLNHPLLAMSTQLLRAAVSNEDVALSRVTAVSSDDPRLEAPLAVAFARYVVVGGDGVRLHEELLHVGGWLRDGGRFSRLENLGLLDELSTAALEAGRLVPEHVQNRLVGSWSRASDGLAAALEWRVAQRRESLDKRLQSRREDEERRIAASLELFAHTLRKALDAAHDNTSERGQLLLELRDDLEMAQALRDQVAWERRLERLAGEQEREIERIRSRYADPTSHVFPVAVAFVVPQREVVR